MSWNMNEEKLLCHMLLDDGFAKEVSPIAGSAFWRAFIVQNRKAGVISCKMRWKYFRNGKDERSWVLLEPSIQGDPEELVEHLRCGIEDVLTMSLRAFGVDEERIQSAVHCFYPPDDGGDPAKTIIWLEQQDLIEIRPAEPEE